MSQPVKRTYRCIECGVEKSLYSSGALPLRCATSRNLVSNARKLDKIARVGPTNAVEAGLYASAIRKAGAK